MPWRQLFAIIKQEHESDVSNFQLVRDALGENAAAKFIAVERYLTGVNLVERIPAAGGPIPGQLDTGPRADAGAPGPDSGPCSGPGSSARFGQDAKSTGSAGSTDCSEHASSQSTDGAASEVLSASVLFLSTVTHPWEGRLLCQNRCQNFNRDILCGAWFYLDNAAIHITLSQINSRYKIAAPKLERQSSSVSELPKSVSISTPCPGLGTTASGLRQGIVSTESMK